MSENEAGVQDESGEPTYVHRPPRRLEVVFDSFSAFVVDSSSWLSKQRLFVPTEEDLRLGSTVQVRLRIAAGATLVRALGEVTDVDIAVREDGPTGVTVEVRFLDPSSAAIIDSVLRLRPDQPLPLSPALEAPQIEVPAEVESVLDDWEDEVGMLVDSALPDDTASRLRPPSEVVATAPPRTHDDTQPVAAQPDESDDEADAVPTAEDAVAQDVEVEAGEPSVTGADATWTPPPPQAESTERPSGIEELSVSVAGMETEDEMFDEVEIADLDLEDAFAAVDRLDVLNDTQPVPEASSSEPAATDGAAEEPAADGGAEVADGGPPETSSPPPSVHEGNAVVQEAEAILQEAKAPPEPADLEPVPVVMLSDAAPMGPESLVDPPPEPSGWSTTLPADAEEAPAAPAWTGLETSKIPTTILAAAAAAGPPAEDVPSADDPPIAATPEPSPTPAEPAVAVTEKPVSPLPPAVSAEEVAVSAQTKRRPVSDEPPAVATPERASASVAASASRRGRGWVIALPLLLLFAAAVWFVGGERLREIGLLPSVDPAPPVESSAEPPRTVPSSAGSTEAPGDRPGAAATVPPTSGTETPPVDESAASTPADPPEADATAAEAVTTPPAVAASPPEAPVTGPADHEAAIRETIERWRRAWSAQDPDSYLAEYAQAFRPENGSRRADWAEQRRVRLRAPSRIAVTVDQLEITEPSGDRAEVLFFQTYDTEAGKRVTWKRFDLVREDGAWKIARERTGR